MASCSEVILSLRVLNSSLVANSDEVDGVDTGKDLLETSSLDFFEDLDVDFTVALCFLDDCLVFDDNDLEGPGSSMPTSYSTPSSRL